MSGWSPVLSDYQIDHPLVEAEGDLPLSVAASALGDAGYLDYPQHVPDVFVHITHPVRTAKELLAQLESNGWLMRDRRIVPLDAPDDRASPDNLGYSAPGETERSVRQQVWVEWRGLNIDASATAAAPLSWIATGSGSVGWAGSVVPLGTVQSISLAQTKQQAGGNIVTVSGVIAATTQPAVTAGLSISVRIGRLDDQYCRLYGSYSDSSFSSGVNTSGTSLPINVDVPLGQWATIAIVSGAGWQAPAGVVITAVAVQVRATRIK